MAGLDSLNRNSNIPHFDNGGGVGSDPIADAFNAAYAAAVAEGQSTTPGGGGTSSGGGGGGGGGGFDAGYYLAANPDVAQNWAGDAYSHYVQYGQNEGRSPTAPSNWGGGGFSPSDTLNIASPYFNPQAYIEAGGGTWNAPSYATQNDISGLYQSILGREADPEGLAYWTQQANLGAPLSAIESAFRSSPEFIGMSPSSGGITNLAPTQVGGGFTSSGVPYENISQGVLGTLADTSLSAKEQADKIYSVAQQYNVSAQDIANALGVPLQQVEGYFQNRVDYPIVQAYEAYLGREPDLEGLRYWRSELEKGKSDQQIASEIARSPESRDLRAAELAGLFADRFDESFLDAVTKEKMDKFVDIYSNIDTKQQYTAPVSQNQFDADYYLKSNPDVARSQYAGDPYQHYIDSGFREGRAPNATGPGLMTADQRYEQVLREAALDPELGAAIKAKDPMLYQTLTPLARDPNQQKTTERIRYGEYGLVNVGGKDIPILNAKAVDAFFGNELSGTMQDFSHHRGNYTGNLGWTSNSVSNQIAKGADALGVTKYTSDVYGTQYAGLEEAAKQLNINPNQFQDKFVEQQSVDEFGNPVTTQQVITAQDQLYDAVSNAAKDIYRVTMDSLTPGKAVEGGAQSFNTVFYQKAGDKLIPITAPQEHGGMQNVAVYRPKDYGFGYYAQGPAFVGAAALSMMAGDPTLGLATRIGSALLPTAAAGAIGATGVGIVGSTVLGSAIGTLSAAGAGGNIEKGALTGGVAGLVASGMKPIMSSGPMQTATAKMSEAMGGAFSQAQLNNVVGASLASTLASATSGANGNQILDAFKNSLISSGVSEKATQFAVAGAKEVFGDDPKNIARTAAATRLVTRTATNAALRGATPEQIQASVISAVVQGAGQIAGAGTQKPTTTQKTEVDGLTQGQRDILLASGSTATDVLPTATEEAIRMISGGGFDRSAYDAAIAAGYSDAEARAYAGGTGNIEITGVGVNPDEKLDFFVPDPYAVLPDVYDVLSKSGNRDAQGGFTGQGATFVRGLPAVVIDAIIKDPSAPKEVKKEAEKAKEEASKKPAAGTEGGGGGGSPEQQKETLIKNAKESAKAAAGNENAEIVVAVSLVDGLIGAGSSITEAIKSAASATGVSQEKISAALSGGSGQGTGTGAGTGTGQGPSTGSGTGGGEGAGTGTGVGDGTGSGTTGTGTGTTGTGTGSGTGGMGTGGGGPGGVRIPRIPPIPRIVARRQVDAETDDYIKNLLAGLTGKMDYTLSGLPNLKSQMSEIPKFADGGSAYNPYAVDKSGSLTPNLTKARLDYILTGLPGNLIGKAEGGSIQEHRPEFFSEGGLGSIENRYVTGNGDGTSDSIPAMLANGEFVIPADVVSSLGNGSNDAGAEILDEFLKTIREHKRAADAKHLPPDSKGPLGYLLDAKRKVKA